MEITKSFPTPVKSHVLVVEDHPIVRHGLVLLINNQTDLCVSGEADSIADALELGKSPIHDLVLVDISLRDGSGLHLISELCAAEPQRPILVLSMHDETIYAERALRLGARGYIMKREAMDNVLSAIRRVLGGHIFVSEYLAGFFTQKMIANRPTTPLDLLSNREFEVFRMMAEGIGPTEIAQKLDLSIRTVEAHRANIKNKLDLKTATELSRFLADWALKHL